MPNTSPFGWGTSTYGVEYGDEPLGSTGWGSSSYGGGWGDKERVIISDPVTAQPAILIAEVSSTVLLTVASVTASASVAA